MDRPRIRSRTFAGALACALTGPLLVLSASGGGDDSVADPPISSSPSSSSPTSAPHRETPEHFIRRWAAEDTRIQQTGDTRQFRAMSQGCSGCIKLANLVDRIYSHGGYIRTKGWHIRRIASVGSGSFDLYVLAKATTYTESANGPPHHLPAGPARFRLALRPKGVSWAVTSLVQVAAQ
jgi:hypothetical protein